MTLGLSPSIDIFEQDALSSNETTGTNFGAFVGNFNWGPVDERTQITKIEALESNFGKPDDLNYQDWFSASSYFAYNNKLRVVRVVGEGSKNAGLQVFSEPLIKLSIGEVTGEENFQKGETVTGSTSTATATVVIVDDGALFVKSTNQNIFEAEESITGSTSSAVATINDVTDSQQAIEFSALKKNKDSIVTVTNDEFVKFKFLAKYCGYKGNDISIAIADTTSFPTALIVGNTKFKTEFPYAPKSTELAIAILENGVIKEKHIVSLVKNTKNYKGINIYIEDYLLQNSKYVYCFDNRDLQYTQGNVISTELSGGIHVAPTASDYINGYNLFRNKEEVDIDVLFIGQGAEVESGETVVQHVCDNIVDVRKDCRFVFGARAQDVVDVNIETAINNLETYIGTTIARDTSYAAFYGNYKYMKDTYSDVYRWIPIAGDVAGCYSNGQMWESPAGYNRGLIKNCVKLAINPDEAMRDTLYPLGINPISTIRNVGHVIYGQKTLLTSVQSIFDRVDNRGLFILLEKTVVDIARFYQFEKNNSTNRKKLTSDCSQIFNNIKGLGGMENYRIVCDDSNNSSSTDNTMYVNVYVQPSGSAEWISVTFTAVSDTVNFEEAVSGQ